MEVFLAALENGIKWYNEYIGGYLILFLLLPTGIFFAIRFKLLNVTKFWHSVNIVRGKYDKKGDPGDVNHFKALTTALSSTVGTGNIVGVALALYWGGPGAIFWIWVCGFFGMMLKMVECTLAHMYRKTNADGTVSGGPMYYMELGLKNMLGKGAKVMAIIFAFATILCSFGTGNMAQSNSMSEVLFTNYEIDPWITGIISAVLILIIIVGGIKRIAEVTSKMVPFMAVFYFLGAILVLVAFYKEIPGAFYLIVHDAFTGTAMTGGFLGSTFIMTMIWGIRRGLFSNEAGQGSAPIAHAAAKTEHPMRRTGGVAGTISGYYSNLYINCSCRCGYRTMVFGRKGSGNDCKRL